MPAVGGRRSAACRAGLQVGADGHGGCPARATSRSVDPDEEIPWLRWRPAMALHHSVLPSEAPAFDRLLRLRLGFGSKPGTFALAMADSGGVRAARTAGNEGVGMLRLAAVRCPLGSRLRSAQFRLDVIVSEISTMGGRFAVSSAHETPLEVRDRNTSPIASQICSAPANTR